MARNLELKARLSSAAHTKKILRQIGQFAEILRQTDTYFNVRVGRLKLREVQGGRAELIYYRRNEKKGPRWSEYEIIDVRQPKDLKRALADALGVKAIVRKVREVYYYRKIARIHVDSVRGLGKFIELEVISKGNGSRVKPIHDELVKLLGIGWDDRIACSYSDLAMAEKGHHSGRI